MKKILLLGAGRSSPVLIQYILDRATASEWQLSIGDVSEEAAKEKTHGHERAEAIKFDVNDDAQRQYEIERTDLVISLLPAALHYLVATDCVKYKKHFLTASYVSPQIQSLHDDALKNDVLLLNECGLDPGIDHMSAMEIIHRLKAGGGVLQTFKSYTGGLVAPESDNNPWGYKISWNPRNVILAGQGTARYIEDGEYKYIPYGRIFTQTENIYVEGLGNFDGYANRDSLAYRHYYGIDNIPTLLRGTLRKAGFCEAWDVFVKLGITDDNFILEDSENLTYAQIVRSYLPPRNFSGNLIDDVAALCGLDPNGESMKKVTWSGIFENRKTGLAQASPAMILQQLLEEKWKLGKSDRDMIVMQHQFEYLVNGKSEKLLSSLIVKGDDHIHTAMAKTVGLPLGIAARLLLENKIVARGVQIPVLEEIYKPVLKELELMKVKFGEVIR
jgi:saccharopine dehydrogenase-like NADP-dependent oxidoreductase